MIGVVLAGGRSSRMGWEKAFMAVDFDRGRPISLLERQVSLLRSVGIENIYVSLRRDLAPAAGSLPVVHDPNGDGGGPLEGIVAAMGCAPGRPLLVLGVDMPGVDEALLGHLLAHATDRYGIAPRIGTRWEPLCAIYPAHALPIAETLRSDRSHGSPSALLDALAARGRMAILPVPDRAHWRLRSWNAPEDVDLLALRSGRSAPRA